MAKVDELAAQVEELRRLLAQHGIQPSPQAVPATERADYIAHGSAGHARFLGLVVMDEKDETFHLVDFTSPRTGRKFRLEDEMGAVQHYPHIAPKEAMQLVLQQKVNELETVPEAPEDAPPMFRPAEAY